MSLQYRTILFIAFTLLAFSSVFVLPYFGTSLFTAPYAHADGEIFGGGDAGGMPIFGGGDAGGAITPIFGGGDAGVITPIFGGGDAGGTTPIFGGGDAGGDTPIFGGGDAGDTPIFGGGDAGEVTPLVDIPPPTPPVEIPPVIIPPVIIIPPVTETPPPPVTPPTTPPTTPPGPPAPICVSLTAAPTTVASGGTTVLTWATTNAVSFSINQGIGLVTPVAAGSTTTPPITSNITYIGTVTGISGTTVTCTASVTLTSPPVTPPGGGGCTSGCGGGGGGGPPPPIVTLSALLHAGAQPLVYLYLSQIPYTGLDLGPLGTALYWLALIGWALALAYLVLFGAFPILNRSLHTFGSRVMAVVNTRESAPVSEHIPLAEELPEAKRGYSTYDGFKSFAHNGALSIEDIVKSLSHKHPAPNVEPVYENVEPIYEHVEPIATTTGAETETVVVSASTRGFTAALLEGDRVAVFAGLRQHVRGNGAPEQLITTAVCLLDDVYRSRIDGSACDSDIARMTARLSTPTLEKLIAALTTAIDSSYSTGVTGAKLSLMRALAILGA